ncbi:DinB family protein [Aneurinibacillus sp. REN35]|uniref:DinB family protein n=1 Tax=Aneurinibacillus sp. REN35 TaxID=3237286 RepID=UPI003526E7C0
MNEKQVENSTDRLRSTLNFQFDIAWQMLDIHLTGLEDEECLWRPARRGLHVVNRLGVWHADWPDTEAYDIGPPSIAWLTWHITFWWSMVFDHSFGNGTLTRENIHWPGNSKAVREKMIQLRDEWKAALATLPDDELLSCKRTKWPFEDKTFYELAAWLNLELMKNAAEIGYCRFLYASQK